MIKKIINHSLIYAILPKLPILLGFLMLPFLTPFLTNTDYGIFGIVMSITTGATVIKGLGLDVILIIALYTIIKVRGTNLFGMRFKVLFFYGL